jgi:dTDP-4-dehydrorhamnose 3,5-epimerase
MDIQNLELPGLVLLTPKRFRDDRGFFSETYSRDRLAQLGYDVDFIQDNHSRSSLHVVRGLHFQAPPYAQDKLIRVIRGRIFDVVVDLRLGSPTYGRQEAVELSAENWQQLLVPAGFAHGFCTLEPDTEILYKVSARYAPECEGGLLWCDPALGIDWPVSPEAAIVSDRDRALPALAAFRSPFRWEAPDEMAALAGSRG